MSFIMRFHGFGSLERLLRVKLPWRILVGQDLIKDVMSIGMVGLSVSGLRTNGHVRDGFGGGRRNREDEILCIYDVLLDLGW